MLGCDGRLRSERAVRMAQSVHGGGNRLTDALDEHLHQGMAQIVGGSSKKNVPHGHRDSKGAHHVALRFAQLQHAELGDEGGSHAALDNAHEGLDAAQLVGLLAVAGAFKLAKLDELVAEAVPLIEQPEGGAAQVVGAHRGKLVKRCALGGIDKVLLVEERMCAQLLQTFGLSEDACIDFALSEGFLDLCGLHLLYAQVELGVLAREAGEEARNEIGGDGGQHAYAESACERAASLVDALAQAARLSKHLLGVLHDDLPHIGQSERLLLAVENFSSQFLFELLHHGTERGLRHVAGLGGFQEVAMLRHGNDIFELLKRHDESWISYLQS